MARRRAGGGGRRLAAEAECVRRERCTQLGAARLFHTHALAHSRPPQVESRSRGAESAPAWRRGARRRSQPAAGGPLRAARGESARTARGRPLRFLSARTSPLLHSLIHTYAFCSQITHTVKVTHECTVEQSVGAIGRKLRRRRHATQRAGRRRGPVALTRSRVCGSARSRPRRWEPRGACARGADWRGARPLHEQLPQRAARTGRVARSARVLHCTVVSRRESDALFRPLISPGRGASRSQLRGAQHSDGTSSDSETLSSHK